MDNYIGRMLDNRYEILEVIGMGGMAVVYKARCHRLNRLVAIKVLKDEYSQDAEFRRRFHAESQAVAMLSHPNIVSVYDVSHSSNSDYIVMELIEGITLKQYLEQKIQLGWREALHFATQIAKALEHAHSRGIIHRDIKPHNIMILKDGSVKVADFGIARITSAQSTLTREALGSVHYISPEQARGSRVDKRSDLYSLGVVMYEMLTGKPPFNGESPVAVAIQHINGTPIQPREMNPNIPEGLEQITMHAMCAAMDRRYESATDMLADLEEFRKDPNVVFDFSAPQPVSERTQVLKTVSDAALRRVVHEKKPARRQQAEPEPERRESDGSGRLAVVAGVIAVVLVVAGLFYFLYATFLKDLFTPTEEIPIPQLVGKRVEDVQGNEAYEDFKLEITYANDGAEAGLIISQDPLSGTPAKTGARIFAVASLGPAEVEEEPPQPVVMPNLVGDSVDSAREQLTAMNFTCQTNHENNDTVPAGNVISTEPTAGTTLQPGQIIILNVSDGPQEKLLKVPSLRGLPIEKAKAKLVEAGFTAEPMVVGYDESDLEKDVVTFQSIDATAEVAADTVINLRLSEGPPEEHDEPVEPDTEEPDPEEPPGENDPDGTEPEEPEEPQLRSKTIFNIPLPQNRVTTTVSYSVDGVPQGVPTTYNTELGTIDLEVKGIGMQVVTVYFDGTNGYSETVDFGS